MKSSMYARANTKEENANTDHTGNVNVLIRDAHLQSSRILNLFDDAGQRTRSSVAVCNTDGAVFCVQHGRCGVLCATRTVRWCVAA